MKTIVAEVRHAEPEDAEDLAGIHEISWRGAYSGLIPHRSLDRMVARRSAAWWRQAIARKAAILVLEFAGEPIGYATLGHNRAQALKVEGEIYEIYLLPEYQGLGFGKRLFDAARDLLRARGMRRFVVWALADNAGAVAFYGNVGGLDFAEGEERFDGVTLRKIAFVWN